jgi:hypothetical protein
MMSRLRIRILVKTRRNLSTEKPVDVTMAMGYQSLCDNVVRVFCCIADRSEVSVSRRKRHKARSRAMAE